MPHTGKDVYRATQSVHSTSLPMRATLPFLALPQWLREGSDRATILRWRNLRRLVGNQ